MRRRPPRLLLFGYLGGGNLGDDLMLAGLLRLVPEGAPVVVLARDPDAVDTSGLDVSIRVRPASMASALREIGRADVVVRVGGTSFHDEYVRDRSRAMAVRYAKLCALFVAPRLLGRQVAALGVGSGRVTQRSTRLLGALAMRCCALVVARDAASADALRAGGGGRRVVAGTDLAWFWAPGTHRDGAAGGLGVSVLDLEPFVAAGIDVDRFWVDLVRRLVEDTSSPRVALFAFKDNDGESDVPVARRVAAALEGHGIETVTWAHGDGIERIAEEVARCDRFVATRYHSAILASMVGVPTAIVPYNTKLRHLAAEAGLAPTTVIDLAPVPSGSRPAAVTFEALSPPGEALAATRSSIAGLLGSGPTP